jgi:hypothetical protein
VPTRLGRPDDNGNFGLISDSPQHRYVEAVQLADQFRFPAGQPGGAQSLLVLFSCRIEYHQPSSQGYQINRLDGIGGYSYHSHAARA